MKLAIVVKANAKHEKIEELPNKSLKVHVKAPPVEGKANQAICKLLAKHFSVPQKSVRVLSGLKSKNKLIEIDADE